MWMGPPWWHEKLLVECGIMFTLQLRVKELRRGCPWWVQLVVQSLGKVLINAPCFSLKGESGRKIKFVYLPHVAMNIFLL